MSGFMVELKYPSQRKTLNTIWVKEREGIFKLVMEQKWITFTQKWITRIIKFFMNEDGTRGFFLAHVNLCLGTFSVRRPRDREYVLKIAYLLCICVHCRSLSVTTFLRQTCPHIQSSHSSHFTDMGTNHNKCKRHSEPNDFLPLEW